MDSSFGRDPLNPGGGGFACGHLDQPSPDLAPPPNRKPNPCGGATSAAAVRTPPLSLLHRQQPHPHRKMPPPGTTSFLLLLLYTIQFSAANSAAPILGLDTFLNHHHSPHLDVSHAPSLASALSDALKAEVAKTPSSLRSSLLPIPHSLVDEMVRHDFEKQKPVEGVYIYFLNLGPQSKPYAYSYTPGDSSPGFTKCTGSIWTGKDRYIWVDLAAGPVDYGPALSGDGVLPRGEFHPLAALHGRPKSHKALLADIASLVWSAYEVLVVPPLRIPVPFESSLIVQFVHVFSGESKDLNGLDWKNIEKVFMDEVNDGALLLGDQSLRFKPYSVSYKECSICSFAISKSINSYTSRFLFDNYTLIVSEYLDSKRLHQILSDSAEEFRR
ncbi:hypothetical protein CRG98_033095, partial [Punica granatum]